MMRLELLRAKERAYQQRRLDEAIIEIRELKKLVKKLTRKLKTLGKALQK